MAHLLIAFMRLIARWPLPLVRALGTGLGAVLWLLAAAMAPANLVGGVVGARTALTRGSFFVRAVFLCMIALLIGRLALSLR